jgi:UDP-N-acetylglucosamine 4-epimerase
MMRGEPVWINGDGETSRDFCYVENAVQANLLAATSEKAAAVNQVYNVAVGGQTTLNELFSLLRRELAPEFPHLEAFKAEHRDFRPGDVRHSRADITKAASLLGYQPTHDIARGLQESLAWYMEQQ